MSPASAALRTVEKSAIIALEGYQNPAPQIDDVNPGNLACETIREIVHEWNSYTQQPARCVHIKPNELDRLTRSARQQPDVGFVIHLRKGTNITHSLGALPTPSKLSLYVLLPEDSTEPQVLRWEINDSLELPSVQKILRKYADFDAGKRDLKKALLAHGLAESRTLSLDRDSQVIAKETGRALSFEEAYAAFGEESSRNKNYLAAGLEIAATLGFWTTLYYMEPDESNVNGEDWDYNKKTTIRARFVTGEAIRFDDNAFNTNRNHYYAGVGYYMIAREAGLSRMESLLVTAAASSFWEFFSEYREVVSINDQINTTVGGFIIGESLHQVAKIFQAGPNTGLNRILKGVFKSPRRMSNWIESKATGKKSTAFSELDSQPDIWSKLDFYSGTIQRQKSGAKSKSFGFNGQVYNIPMFEEPGRVQTLLMNDTVYSQLSGEMSNGLGLESVKLYAKTALAAIYDKNLTLTQEGRLQGYNLLIGPSLGVEVNQETTDSVVASGTDQQGIVHVFGSTVDLVIYQSGVRFRCVLDIYGDFAMMRSYAYENYATQYGTTGVQSVLQRRGYYYGVGGTQSLSAVANYRNFEAGVRYQSSTASMINTRSRQYEIADPNMQADDRIQNVNVWVAYQLNSKLRLEAGLEKIIREGKLNNVSVNSTDLRKYGRLVYSYK